MGEMKDEKGLEALIEEQAKAESAESSDGKAEDVELGQRNSKQWLLSTAGQ